MKIAVLHGAIINAGDFLIKNRAISLLKYFYPDSEIVEYYRNQSLEEKLPEINACDILVFAGGPGYCNGFYPRMAPVTDDLNKIKNSHKIGDEMNVKVNRNGQEKELTLTLGEQP